MRPTTADQVDQADLEPLRREWPGWSFWRSRRGRLVCATRRRDLTNRERWFGLAPTLVEDDVPALTARLRQQQDREHGSGL